MYKLNTKIDFKENKITLNHNNIQDIIKITEFNKPSQIEINQINHINNEICDDLEIEESNIDNLTNEQRSEFNELLGEFKHLGREEIGLLNTYEHSIIVNDETPFFKQPYKLKASDFDKACSVINKWEEEEIIEKSNSCYINPLVFVKKSDGELRPCLDARFINNRTIPEFTTPEKIHDILRSFNNIKFISVLDLRSSFLQVNLNPHSRKYTAFKFNHSVYHFTRVPFGLKNSLAAFIKAIDPVIPKELKENIKNYVDDILIVSSDFKSHIFHLRTIFDRLLKFGATLKFQKCKFFMSSVKFVGHIISNKGIFKDPEKIQAIRDYPRPTNPKQIQSFLGLLNFYNQFTNRYAELAAPLTKLIRKGVEWEWGDTEENNFIELKRELCKNIHLTSPDFNRDFHLECDASLIAVGGILYQLKNGNEKQIIACYSKKLTDREIRVFTVTEKELYSIIIAIKKFFDTVAGYNIIVHSDHQALCHLFECKNPPPRIHRWILFLQPLNLTFTYIPGKNNQIADTLSRNINIINKNSNQDIFERIKNEQFYENDFVKNLNQNYKFENKILFIKLHEKWLMHIPPHLIIPLIEYVHHTYNHIGTGKTYKLIQERFSCKALKKHVKKMIKSCHICQTCKAGPCIKYCQSYIRADYPLSLVSLDFFGPLPTGQYKFKYILVIVDNFSKYVKLYPTISTNLISIKKRVLQYLDFISNIGKIDKILTDNATTFTSNKWIEFLNNHKIKPILTAIRRPQSNISERVNREIVCFLRVLLRNRHNGWVKYLKEIEDCINTTYHSGIDNIPYKVFLGLNPPRPWEKLQTQNLKLSKLEYDSIIERVKLINNKKSDKLDELNKKFQSKLKVGDKVLIKSSYVSSANEQRVGKLCPKFDGPYLINKKLGKNVFLLVTPKNECIRGIFHASLIKRYYSEDN